MRTTRANPSSAIDATAPTPSTWPCTTWPPSRPPARTGSSRLTSLPAASGPSEERRSVSAITSAAKESARTPRAVRQTPFTATESPSASSPASGLATESRAPSPSRSTAATVPVASTSPVNISASPIPQPGDDQHVVVDALDVERDRAHRVVDPLDALRLDRGARLAPAGEQRRDEHPRLVDLARLEEDAGEVGAALEQQRLDVARAELVERRADARRLVLPRRDDHVDPGVAQRVGLGPLRGARADHGHRDVAGAADQPRVERQAGLGVEDHAPRLVSSAGDARGQQRVVLGGRVDADRDGVALGAPAVGAGAAGLTGDPLRVAAARGDLAVERHRGLEDHQRTAATGVLAKRLVEQPFRKHARSGRPLVIFKSAMTLDGKVA